MEAITTALFGTGGLLKVRGIATLAAVFVTLYMWADGTAVSEIQLGIVTAWTSFYFGTRAGESKPA